MLTHEEIKKYVSNILDAKFAVMELEKTLDNMVKDFPLLIEDDISFSNKYSNIDDLIDKVINSLM